MIRKLVRQMLTAQIFSALTVTLCLLIDSIMVGRFLGVKALSAYQLANPILLVVAAAASMLSAGVQVACGRSLGKGSREETDAGYSSALVFGLGIAVVLTLLVLVFRSAIATAIGAGKEGTLFDDTRNYLAGFVIGAPGTMGALILVPFLQIAGQSGLLIAAVLAMTVMDVALDLLNVLVVHWGMFGMGLASSLSYYCALIIGGWYFISKKCVFRFSWQLVRPSKIVELLKSGIPTVVGLTSSVVLVLLLNHMLLSTGGSGAVAAFSAVTNIGNAANCITTGISGVSLTLCGVFYSEEDKTALKELMQLLARHAIILCIVAGSFLILAAPVLVRLFIAEPGAIQEMAVLGIRLFTGGMIPCCIVGSLRYGYQAMDKVFLTEVLSVAENAAFPALAAFVMSRFLGTTGVWFYFALGELLSLIALGIFIRLRTRSIPWRDGAYLLLQQTFGVPKDQLMEVNIGTVEDAVRVSKDAEVFCRSRGQSTRLSRHIALCIEEMAANIVEHGFSKDTKEHHLSVRVLHKKDYWVLRFRDDCRAFDPVHYIPKEEKDALGIRLTLAMAEDAQYTYSMNLNNLMLKLPDEKEK